MTEPSERLVQLLVHYSSSFGHGRGARAITGQLTLCIPLFHLLRQTCLLISYTTNKGAAKAAAAGHDPLPDYNPFASGKAGGGSGQGAKPKTMRQKATIVTSGNSQKSNKPPPPLLAPGELPPPPPLLCCAE